MKSLQRISKVSVVIVAVLLFASGLCSGAVNQVQAQSQTKQQAEPVTPDVEAMLRSAFALQRNQKYDEALVILDKVVRLSPKDFRPLVLTAYIYSVQRKMKSASQMYAAAISLKPDSKELYMAKGEVDYLRNAHEEALAAYRKAVEVDPEFAEAYVLIGDLLAFDKKRRPEAVAALQSALKINPTLPGAYEILGNIRQSENDEAGAEKIYRQGMAADPKHMGGRFTLGRLLVKQGRLVEARELWNGRTSDEDRSYPQFFETLKRAENLRQATEALARQPKDPDALINMGFAVMEGDSWVVDGRQERAIVYFQQALGIKPDSARAQYGICKALIQIADTFGKDKKALDLELAKLRRLDPKLADEMEQYAKTYHGGLIGSPVKNDQ